MDEQQSPQISWPEKPTCHEGARFASELKWREPEPSRQPYGTSFRTCSYCGSIHPEDLLHYLQAGNVRLGGSDWKYGWPHKFYVDGIPNPLAGKIVETGSESKWVDGERVSTPIYSPAADSSPAKWYNCHLSELSDEAFALLAPLLHQHSGIEFFRQGEEMWWRAPHHGYQR
jgi:hypothetical protein